MAIALLNHRLGNLAPALEQQIYSLSLEQLAALAKALFDFGAEPDLVAWLESIHMDQS